MQGSCDTCIYNFYDEADDFYECTAYLDQDELYRRLESGGACPYYRSGDEYELVRHQN